MIDLLAKNIIERIRSEWQAQGHTLTGAAERSLRYEADKTHITIFGVHYMGYIETGVKPADIRYPYAKKRLAGLTLYGMLRLGLPERLAKRFAGAVATLHKRFGAPLPTTVKFSKTGKRTGYIASSIDDIKRIVTESGKQIIKTEIYGNNVNN